MSLPRFYPIFDSADWVSRALAVGVRMIQLRMKDASDEALRAEIARAREALGNVQTLALTATAALVAGMVALTVFAGPMMRYADATARQLVDPEPYIGAVLRDQEGVK